jgi:hypothetical protein
MKTFQTYDNVVVERKGKVMFGTIVNIRQFFTNSLITVKYTDGEDTWFRSYYDDDNATKIEHDEVFA